MWLNRSILALLAGLWLVAGSARPAAGQGSSAKSDSNFFFMSGTVSELENDRITITRSVAGKPTEKHSFITTPETTIEGKLKVKARVTVGYIKGEEADTAVRIIVRSSSPPPSKK